MQNLPTAQASPALTDSFSWGHDPSAHACKARSLHIVPLTPLPRAKSRLRSYVAFFTAMTHEQQILGLSSSCFVSRPLPKAITKMTMWHLSSLARARATIVMPAYSSLQRCVGRNISSLVFLCKARAALSLNPRA